MVLALNLVTALLSHTPITEDTLAHTSSNLVTVIANLALLTATMAIGVHGKVLLATMERRHQRAAIHVVVATRYTLVILPLAAMAGKGAEHQSNGASAIPWPARLIVW